MCVDRDAKAAALAFVTPALYLKFCSVAFWNTAVIRVLAFRGSSRPLISAICNLSFPRFLQSTPGLTEPSVRYHNLLMLSNTYLYGSHHLTIGISYGEYGAMAVEVPVPHFTAQGISPLRDVDYD
jgi:hypothetical protein